MPCIPCLGWNLAFVAALALSVAGSPEAAAQGTAGTPGPIAIVGVTIIRPELHARTADRANGRSMRWPRCSRAFADVPFARGMLRRFGHPLALVEVNVPDDVAEHIVDLDDPAQLARLGLRPSTVASDDRRRTGRIAAVAHSLPPTPP